MRRRRWLLIDGANVLHQDRSLATTYRRDPEAARRCFEASLPRDAVVVWDGGPGGRQSSRQREGVLALYAGPGPDAADQRILAWLRAHDPRQVLLITRDRQLAAQARALGALVRPALPAAAPPSPATDEDRGPPPADEIDDWLRAFGVNCQEFGAPLGRSFSDTTNHRCEGKGQQ